MPRLSTLIYVCIVLAVMSYILEVEELDQNAKNFVILGSFGLFYLFYKRRKKRAARKQSQQQKGEMKEKQAKMEDELKALVSSINAASDASLMKSALQKISACSIEFISSSSFEQHKDKVKEGIIIQDEYVPLKKFIDKFISFKSLKSTPLVDILYPVPEEKIFDESQDPRYVIPLGSYHRGRVDSDVFNAWVAEKMLIESNEENFSDISDVANAYRRSYTYAFSDFIGHLCTECGKGTEQHISKENVRTSFRHETKDGDMDKRYDDNPLTIVDDYTVKCRHCGQTFTDRVTDRRE